MALAHDDATPAPRGRYGHTKRNPWASAYDREQER